MAGAVNITFGAIVSGFVSNIGQATQSISGLVSGLGRATEAAGRFSRELNGNLAAGYASADREQRVFDRGLGRLADGLQSFGRKASLVTAGIALVGASAFSAYADINALQLGLENITGSAEGAIARFNELRPIVRLPGLGLEEAVKGDVRLQAVGFSAEKSKNILLEFGNALALTGGGKFELNSILTQLTQMGSKAKVLSEDLKPILTSSPAVAKAIKELFGTVDSEQISAKLQATGRGPQDFINDLVAKLSELERVKGGPKNAIENFSDSVKLAQFQFGQAADKALSLTDKLNGLGDFLGNAAEGFGSLSSGSQLAILSITGVAAAIGPLSLGIGTFITLLPTLKSGLSAIQTGLVALTGTVGVTVIAVTAIVGTIALLSNAMSSYSANLETTVNASQLLSGITDKVGASIAGEQSKLESLLSVARDETVSKKARQEAISAINAISPQYLGNLRLDTINTAQATAAISQYTNALTLKAKVQVLSQQAAEAALAVDRAQAKSAKEFVDKSRFSADRVATNIKTTFSFDAENDREKLLDDLGKRRKDAEVARAKDTANIIERELKSAYLNASKAGINTQQASIKPFNYSTVDLGGSAAKKAKDQLKKLKDEITSGKLAGKDVSDLQQQYDALKASLDNAGSSFKKQRIEVESNSVALTTNEQILKRLSRELREQGNNAPDALRERVGLFRELVAAQKEAANAKPVDLGDSVKPISANAGRSSNAIESVFNGGVPKLQGLTNFQTGIAEQVRDQRLATQAELLAFRIDLAEFPGFLSMLSMDLSAAGSNVFTATGEKIRESVGRLADVMRQAKETLLSSSVDAFAGIGEGIARASTGIDSAKEVLGGTLKAIVNILADYVTTIGKAMILTAIPLIASGFGAGIGTKQLLTGGALVLAGGIARGLAATAFAQGGLVYGPTLGLVGEGRGTSRNNPEVIAPLDKLKGFMGPRGAQNVTVSGRFELEGSTAVALIERQYESDSTLR